MKTVKLESTRCPLGCEKNDESVTRGTDLLHNLPGEFTVVKCKTCELMRTSPRPTPDSMGFYYPDNYGPYIGTQVQESGAASQRGTRTEGALKRFLKRFIKVRLNVTPLPKVVPGKLLEFGCASGAFLHQMAGKGWQVEGIEFSEKAAQQAAKLGYRVHTGALETISSSKESFDLIVGWMVLEHLHDPIGGLIKLREWAKPGAYLVISVPNAGSLEFQIFKNKWYALQLPTHLHHFTPSTLEKVLQASGWKMEKVFHQRILTNLLVSIGYTMQSCGYPKLGSKMVEYFRRPSKLQILLYPLAVLLSVFGQTGRMTIWARPAT